MIIIIDIETSSCADLRDCGVTKYAADPSTEILCVSYMCIDNDGEIVEKKTIPGNEIESLRKLICDENVFVAHNTFFEYSILKAKGLFIPLYMFRCTMAFASLVNLPHGLDQLALFLDVEHKKDREGKSAMMRLCKKPIDKSTEDYRLDMTILLKYCMSDVEATKDLYEYFIKHYPEAENWFSNKPASIENDIYSLTEKINLRGLPVDLKSSDIILKFIERIEIGLLARFKTLTKDAIKTPGQRVKIMSWCEEQGYPLSGYTKNDIEEHLKDKNIPGNVKELLKIRRLTSKSSIKKLLSLKNRAVDNRVHDLFFYRGAHTGRWTARGFQPQNLKRSGIKCEDFNSIIECFDREDLTELKTYGEDPFSLASQCIRPIIKASEDKKFFCGDFKSIETMVLWWLVGDYAGLSSFKNGDPYIDMASVIFDKPKEKITKEERFLGKTVVLGCGYGMGAETFKKRCGLDYGLEISAEFAKKCVNSYRNTHKEVVSFWYAIEKQFIHSIVPGSLYTRLKPEGLLTDLIYNNARYTPKEGITYNGYHNGKWSKLNSYGGKLTENIVQSIARDIMSMSMLILEKNKFPIVMTVHDEILCEAEDDRSLDIFTTLMERGANYLKGIKKMDIPLTVEAWSDFRYFK